MIPPSSGQPTHTIHPDERPTDTGTPANPTADGQVAAAGGDSHPVAGPAGYELLDEVGRGGMGVVYRARDLALDRDVAVKLLADRYPADSFTARRFLDEARITGQLQHPGIPAVHQVGALPDGRPFLAMKLIKGRTLDELLKGRPDPAADRGRFLAVFEQVCQAVGYAHAHWVIHRDLKPSNVMVGAFGEVQVMDWGLAKVLRDRGDLSRGEADGLAAALGTEIRPSRGAEEETQAGSLLGTPAYMAPEQAIGAVDRLDERTDVFGLGGLLCVVLTGKPPYVSSDLDSTLQLATQARQDETHARLAACGAEPELVALCKRCLASEPGDRPRHAGEVAAAVAALRADAEDRARQAELDRTKAEVQAAEQRKRRKVQAALAAAVLAAGGLAAGGGWWLDRQAAARETEKRVEVARDREAAEVALVQAEAALRKENPISGEIDAALAQAETRLADGGPDDLRDRLAELTKARRMLDRLDAIDTRRWSLGKNRAGGDNTFARSEYPAAFQDHGLDLAAEQPVVLANKVRRSPIAARLAAALDDWMAVGGPPVLLELIGHLDPDPDRTALRRALTVNNQTEIVARVAKLDGWAALPAFAAFVGGHERTPPPEGLRILRAAQQAHPTHFGLALQTAFRVPVARTDDRITYYRIALAIRPANPICSNNLGVALSERGDQDGAIAAYRAALRLDPRYAIAHNNLGLALRDKGDSDGAVAAFREAVRLDPENTRAHNNLGITLRNKGDLDGMVAAFREVVRLDPGDAKAHNNLGNALHEKGDLDGAVAAYRAALRLDPENTRAHNNLGNALWDKGDGEGAIKAYREAVRLKVVFAPAYTRLAMLLARRGEPRAALDVLQQGMQVNPNWLTDPITYIYYDSACYACRAAAGTGKDVPPPAERPALRKQALDWLTADLTAWRKQLAADPAKNRAVVHGMMAHWLTDSDLESVRERAELEKLPLDERVGWVKLWTEVRELRDATTQPEAAPPPRQVS